MFANDMSTKHVVYVAALSRLGMFLLQLVGNALLPDHVSQDAFNPPATTVPTPVEQLSELALGGFRRWDAIHFTHIAQHGYTFEHSAAFLPLLPITINWVTKFVLQSNRLYLLAGCLLNAAYFTLAALFLHRLTRLLFVDRGLPTFTVFLFCLNPANIFFSAVYSESLYSMLTFMGLYLLTTNSFYVSLIPFGLSALCRSNGLLNAGYLVYFCSRCFLSRGNCNFVRLIVYVSKCLLVLLAISAGFALYQNYIYLILCDRNLTKVTPHPLVREYAKANGYKLIADFKIERWCYDFFPLSYRYIQARYWHVGFMTYWTIRQLPNFLLAAPVLILSALAILSYFHSVPGKKLFDLFGMLLPFNTGEQLTYKANSNLYPYAVHLIVLMISGLFYMHVQVSTRFIFSSNPLIYWYLASLLCTEYQKQNQKKQKIKSISRFLLDLLKFQRVFNPWLRLAVLYFIGYTVGGTIMFVNFLPFT